MPAGITVETDLRRLRQMMKRAKGKHVRVLHDGVPYGVFQEFGTSKMPAQPFMRPAAEAVRPEFNEGWEDPHRLEDAETFVDRIAFRAQAEAQVRCPVDTGALRASLRVDKAEDL